MEMLLAWDDDESVSLKYSDVSFSSGVEELDTLHSGGRLAVLLKGAACAYPFARMHFSRCRSRSHCSAFQATPAGQRFMIKGFFLSQVETAASCER